MTFSFDDFGPDGILPQEVAPPPTANLIEFHAGKDMLITGAGGSIGSALSRAIHEMLPRSLVLLDSSETNLFRIHSLLSALPGLCGPVPILGSVTDERCLNDVFDRFRPKIIYHAAALKHVPLMEMNPLAVVRNNVLGTYLLANVARHFHASHLLMVSTDKAVNPHSIMGASKRAAEIVLSTLGVAGTRMSSIRLGNVLGSEGSVVPLFLDQIAQGGPVTGSHPEVDRYFLSMHESVSYILHAAASPCAAGSICVPPMRQPMKIVDLARYLIQRASAANVSISFTGLRPGDKLHEHFVSDLETMSPELSDGLHWIDSPSPSPEDLADGIAALNAALNEMSFAKLLDAITRLVPEYVPSPYLREQVALAAVT